MLHHINNNQKEKDAFQSNLSIDMHCHILPFFDNGPKDMYGTVEICKNMYQFGIRKCIVTPHIMSGYYENSVDDILQSTEDLKNKLIKENIPLKIKPAAEYFVDEIFFSRLKNNHKLLTLDNVHNHVLIGMNFLSDFEYFKYVTQRISDFGYIPVLVHAEKFNLLFEKTENITILKRKGLKIQSDLCSFFSINSKSTKSNLKHLIDNQLIDFTGTNINSLECSLHLPELKNNPEYEKLFHLNIQNHLLDF